MSFTCHSHPPLCGTAYHHPVGLVCLSKGSDNMGEYIVGISKPSNKESETKVTEGLVLDVELRDRVFKVPIMDPRNRKSLQQSSILKSLATWGNDGDITTLVKSMLDGSGLGSLGQGGGKFLKEATPGNTNIRQRLRKDSTYCSRHYMETFGFQGCYEWCGLRNVKYLSDFQFGVGVSVSEDVFT
ncbi:hypothetical protein Tco_0637748 [Tanacetum coccineum]